MLIIILERVKRIELSQSAWKAEVLPLNYTRILGRLMGIEPTNVGATIRCVNHFATIAMAGVAGIEPTLTVLETAVLPLNYTPIYLVPEAGLEPATYWLQVSCSTNWAIPAKCIILIHKLLYININKIAIINFFIFLYLIRMVPYFISYISKLHLWHKKKSYLLIIIKLVPRAGIEPARVSPPAGF